MRGYCLKVKEEVLSEADCYYCELRDLGYEPSKGKRSLCVYWTQAYSKLLKRLEKERKL